MKEIKLNLTIDDTNLILEALGSMPFTQVYQLIGKIQQQAGAQLSENGQVSTPMEAEPVNVDPKKK